MARNYRRHWIDMAQRAPSRQTWYAAEIAQTDAIHRCVIVLATNRESRSYLIVRGPSRNIHTTRINSASYERLERYRHERRDWAGRLMAPRQTFPARAGQGVA